MSIIFLELSLRQCYAKWPYSVLTTISTGWASWPPFFRKETRSQMETLRVSRWQSQGLNLVRENSGNHDVHTHTVLTMFISPHHPTYLPLPCHPLCLCTAPGGGPPPSESRAGHTQVIEVCRSPAPRFPSAIPSPATDVYPPAALTVSN